MTIRTGSLRCSGGTVFLLLWMAASVESQQADPFIDDITRAADVSMRPKVLERKLPAPGTPGDGAPVGQLRIAFVVERNGTVQHARVSGDPGPYQSAAEAVISHLRGWRFTPGMRDGGAVRTLATLTVSYAPRGYRGVPASPPPTAGTWFFEGVDDDFGAGAARRGDPGFAWPRVKKEVKPEYPQALRREGPSGSVTLEVHVLATGRVAAARVVSSTDERFNANAIASALKWEFEPGMKAGSPAPVVVSLMLEFRMR